MNFSKEEFIKYTQVACCITKQEAEIAWEDEEQRGLYEGDLFILSALQKDINGNSLSKEQFHQKVKELDNEN